MPNRLKGRRQIIIIIYIMVGSVFFILGLSDIYMLASGSTLLDSEQFFL